MFPPSVETRERYDTGWSIGDSHELVHRLERHQKARERQHELTEEILEKLERGELPGRWLKFKMWWADWSAGRHHEAATSGSRGIVSLLYFLFYEILYVVILIASYAVFGALLIWLLPHFLEWLFQMP